MRGSFKTIAILAAIPLVGLAAFFFWQWTNGGELPQETYDEAVGKVERPAATHVNRDALKPEAPPVKAGAASRRRRSKTDPLPELPREGRGDIVLIIDDLGFDGQPLERLMALDQNVNCSILPNGTRAAEFADRLNARGFEILCHLPMEPRGGAAPGRNAILTSMSDEEIARLTRENIEAIPHARGVNNHMGSRATADRRVMTSVLRAMPDELYFIDSRTGAGSVAEDVAREMNVRTAGRHVFLDDVATEREVRRQVRQLASAAQKQGVAIGIGHPYPVTLRVLAEELPALRERGFRLIRASEVVR